MDVFRNKFGKLFFIELRRRNSTIDHYNHFRLRLPERMAGIGCRDDEGASSTLGMEELFGSRYSP